MGWIRKCRLPPSRFPPPAAREWVRRTANRVRPARALAPTRGCGWVSHAAQRSQNAFIGGPPLLRGSPRGFLPGPGKSGPGAGSRAGGGGDTGPVSVDTSPPPCGHSRHLTTNRPGGPLESSPAHTSVIANRNAGVFEKVWLYLRTEPVAE